MTQIQTLPTAVTTANDYESLAQARLDPAVWHYLQAGSGAGLTLAANYRAFAARPLWPRPLAAVRGGHTRLTFWGQTLAHPILLAPIAYQRLFHPDGEVASAFAAAAQGGGNIVSSLASLSLEAIAQASFQGGQAPWFQLYWQGERARTLRLLRRAEAAGYAVIVWTIDAPVKHATLILPTGTAAETLEQPLLPARLTDGQSQVFDGWMAQAPTWDDLAWLREQSRLPLLLKGILHPEDAERAVQLGCDGLVVSNHGGRVLDGAPASLDALTAVVARVAGRMPVLLDSGVRTGQDACRALQAGATAVLVGRPYIWGLVTAGALGVAQVIRLLRDELELSLALTGHATLATVIATPAAGSTGENPGITY